MKKLLIIVLALFLFTPIVHAIDADSVLVAWLSESPRGRIATPSSAELMTIWYTGAGGGLVGVSGITASRNLEIIFYEAGQVVTAARFAGYAAVTIGGTPQTTATTVEGAVDVINSDTSGLWHAALGRDATPGTSTVHIKGGYYFSAGIDEQASIDAQGVLYDSTNSSLQLLCGFRGESHKTNRLKQFEEDIKGTGTHTIRIWDGKEVIWTRTYSLEGYSSIAAFDAITFGSVTPLVVKFDGAGLSATKGNNLTVQSTWSGSLIGSSEREHINIIVGQFEA